MLRVVFFGNSASGFTARHFEALLKAPAELAAVVDVPPHKRRTTNPLEDGGSVLAKEARRRDIACFEPRRTDDPGFVTALQSLGADLFVAAGYALIFKQQLLQMPRMLAANFHASLLPAYRGKHPVFWALRNGEKWAGLSVHVMERSIDSGDIIYQVKVRTRRNDSVASLYERIMEKSVPLVERLVLDAQHGAIPRKPQPEGSGSYYSGTAQEDFRLDWSMPAAVMRRWITATPGRCYLQLQGGRLYVIDARVESCTEEYPAGSILRIGRSRVLVSAGESALSLGRVRTDEGLVQSMAVYCREMGLGAGDRLVERGSR